MKRSASCFSVDLVGFELMNCCRFRELLERSRLPVRYRDRLPAIFRVLNKMFVVVLNTVKQNVSLICERKYITTKQIELVNCSRFRELLERSRMAAISQD